jgi:CRP/FNR family transcriptional regulator, cyclic AMP receptor protein
MKTLLLIEDNDDIRENTAEILELANYKVYTADNGKTGVELALVHRPDLIICDIMMPVLDGYGVLHAIHKNDEIKNTPFIFLTAKTERGDMRKGMELGADDYITKPFEGTELLTAVDSRLKKASLLKKEISAGLEGLNELLFAGTERNALKNLTEHRPVNKYRKKQVIYAEGNRPVQLFYVLSGKIKTCKSNDDGKELVTDLYQAGDYLGYTALLEGGTYKETAEAMEDVEVALIPKEEFEKLINNNREVARSFIKILAKTVQEKEEQLLGMAYNSLRKKVAEALTTLWRKYHKEPAAGPFSIDISRENLATIAGTATESLIRTLSDFKSEKMIDVREGRIVFLDAEKIARLAN